MQNSSARRGAKVRFGRHKAFASPLTIHREPDREGEPEVSTQPEGSEEGRSLAKSKVSFKLVREARSVLVVWSVWHWVVNSCEKEAGCR